MAGRISQLRARAKDRARLAYSTLRILRATFPVAGLDCGRPAEGTARHLSGGDRASTRCQLNASEATLGSGFFGADFMVAADTPTSGLVAFNSAKQECPVSTLSRHPEKADTPLMSLRLCAQWQQASAGEARQSLIPFLTPDRRMSTKACTPPLLSAHAAAKGAACPAPLPRSPRKSSPNMASARKNRTAF